MSGDLRPRSELVLYRLHSGGTEACGSTMKHGWDLRLRGADADFGGLFLFHALFIVYIIQ